MNCVPIMRTSRTTLPNSRAGFATRSSMASPNRLKQALESRTACAPRPPDKRLFSSCLRGAARRAALPATDRRRNSMVCCQSDSYVFGAVATPPPDPHTEESTMQDAIIVPPTHDDAARTHPAVSRRVLRAEDLQPLEAGIGATLCAYAHRQRTLPDASGPGAGWQVVLRTRVDEANWPTRVADAMPRFVQTVQHWQGETRLTPLPRR